MDKIFYNGLIKTLDQAYPEVSALAIKNGVIMRMGSDEEILGLAGKETEKIDLQGNLMLPGFIDSHMHLMLYANFIQRIDMTEVTSYQEVVEIFKAEVPEAKKSGKWILARSFNQDDWSDSQAIPTRKDLDFITNEVPIFMQRSCGHIATMNTKAMELVGLLNETPDTKHKLGFYSDGTPNGQIMEHSTFLVQDYLGVPPVEELKKLVLECCNEAASKGLTQVHSDDFTFWATDDRHEVMQAFKELAEADELPIRVYEQCRFPGLEELKAFIAEGYRPNQEFGQYKIGPIKIMGDGSLGAHTAAMRTPYKNEPGQTGILIHNDEEMYELFEVAHKNGFSIVVHCIGDAALEQTLNGYERVVNEYPRANVRDGVIHCQIMDAKQQDRFRELNVIAYVQPVFVRADGKIVDDCVGEELAKQSYNWRRYKDLGVHMCGGSDCPVEPLDPIPNIYFAVSRSDGKGGAPWYPENGVTISEAIEMFTKEGAYAAFEENERGTLTVGKYADMVVLNKNLYEIPTEEIKDTEVLMTVVNGKIRYQK